MRPLIQWKKIAASGVILGSTLTLSSIAGRIEEPWDQLPRVSRLSFSPEAIGITTESKDYFLIDRKKGQLTALSEAEFTVRFAKALGSPATAEKRGESGLLLHTSPGKDLTTSDAYCSEGSDQQRKILFDGKHVTSPVNPCLSIAAAEWVDRDLWLGTRRDGEYGEYGGDGIVVQSFPAGKLLGKIASETGLSGDLIRVIRVDPFGKLIWVVTEYGLDEVGRDRKVIRSRYFANAFDPATGKPRLELVTQKGKTDPFVPLARQLQPSDSKKFYEAVHAIPREDSESFFGELGGGLSVGSQDSFSPPSMNALTPFLIEAMEVKNYKVQWTAAHALCKLDDPRARAFWIERSRVSPSGPSSDAVIAGIGLECLQKYVRLNRLDPAQRQALTLQFANQLQALLATYRAGGRPDGTKIVQAPDQVTNLTRSLQRLGSSGGFDQINAYFARSDFNPADTDLYDGLAARLSEEDALMSTMLAGLQRIPNHAVSRSCTYFDIRYHKGNARRGAVYARLLKLAVDRLAVNGGPPPESDPFQSGGYRACKQSLEGQLQDAAVQAEYLKPAAATPTPPPVPTAVTIPSPISH